MKIILFHQLMSIIWIRCHPTQEDSQIVVATDPNLQQFLVRKTDFFQILKKILQMSKNFQVS